MTARPDPSELSRFPTELPAGRPGVQPFELADRIAERLIAPPPELDIEDLRRLVQLTFLALGAALAVLIVSLAVAITTGNDLALAVAVAVALLAGGLALTVTLAHRLPR